MIPSGSSRAAQRVTQMMHIESQGIYTRMYPQALHEQVGESQIWQ